MASPPQGKHAAQFTSDRALPQAREAVQNSTAFKAKAALGESKIVIETIFLEEALGINYLDHVRGKSRVGSKNHPTSTVTTDLTDGHLVAFFHRTKEGTYKLHTLFPNPK